MQNKTIARRKGSKVRYFDPQTARMGKWVDAPKFRVFMNAADLNKFTVAQLRDLGQRYYGVHSTTKTRKAQIVDYILEAQR